MMYYPICAFEHNVWEVEGVRIVVLAPTGKDVQEYDYDERSEGMTLNALIELRIQDKVGKDVEVIAIDGRGKPAKRGQHLDDLRKTYHDWS